MKIEDRLRDALHGLSEDVPADAEVWERIRRRVRRPDARRYRVVALAVAAALVAVVAVVIVRPGERASQRITTGPQINAGAMPSEIVALTTDGKLVVLSSSDGHVIRRLADHAVFDAENENADTSTSLAITPDGKTVYFMEGRPLAGASIASVPVAGGPVRSPFGNSCCGHNPVVSPDGRWLATTGVVNHSDAGRDVLLYDLRRGSAGNSWNYTRRWTSGAPLRKGTGPLAWAPDSQHLAFIQNDTPDAPSPRVLDINTPDSTPLDEIPPVRFQADETRWAGYLGETGQMLAIVGGDVGRVVATDATTGTVTRILFELWGATQPVADPSGNHILVQGTDGLYLWNESDSQARKITAEITTAAWVPTTTAVHSR